ncbi:unnamed protein product [Somion occarium]|uniref:Secreted protein n=1 Tax=Somion occarium TaxID=3059160 RepID=A0ABP1CIV5_9APHY
MLKSDQYQHVYVLVLGVWTVISCISPVNNAARICLKNEYRHVFISRKFGLKHGFIPLDVSPGHHGYEGLIAFRLWYSLR